MMPQRLRGLRVSLSKIKYDLKDKHGINPLVGKRDFARKGASFTQNSLCMETVSLRREEESDTRIKIQKKNGT